MVAYISEIERLKVAVAHNMEEYEDGHRLAVGHEAQAVAATFAGGVQRVFSQFRCKIFANSSRILKISIEFASVMGMDVLYNLLIVNCKYAKIFHFHNFFKGFLIPNSR